MSHTLAQMTDSENGFDSIQFGILKDCVARKFLSIHHRSVDVPSVTTSKTRSKSKTARIKAKRGTINQSAVSASADVLDSSDTLEELSGDPLDEFATYIAAETWEAIPTSLRDLSFATTPVPSYPKPSSLTFAIPASIPDTLLAYAISSDDDDVQRFVHEVITSYIETATAPPPVWKSTRTEECEICEREVPLTYHHLIPRSTHDKVLKKGWHPEEMLNSVAWLCRQCHSAVHHVAPNEELARNFYTVELLLGREDIQKWKKYAAKQRFGYKWQQNREY